MRLYEEFTGSFEFRSAKILDRLAKNARYWFDEGCFSGKDAEFVKTAVSGEQGGGQYTVAPMGRSYRSLTIDFLLDGREQKVIITLFGKEEEAGRITKAHVEIRSYGDDDDLVGHWESPEPVELGELEDGEFILDQIGEMTEEGEEGILDIEDEGPATEVPEGTPEGAQGTPLAQGTPSAQETPGGAGEVPMF